MAKHPEIKAVELDFEGKNILLYFLAGRAPLCDPVAPLSQTVRGPAQRKHWWLLSVIGAAHRVPEDVRDEIEKGKREKSVSRNGISSFNGSLLPGAERANGQNVAAGSEEDEERSTVVVFNSRKERGRQHMLRNLAMQIEQRERASAQSVTAGDSSDESMKDIFKIFEVN